MNIEDLQRRAVDITNEMHMTKANYAKLEGHLAETNHWISELVKKEQEIKELENGESEHDNAEQVAEG